jgi:hypothetical protein
MTPRTLLLTLVLVLAFAPAALADTPSSQITSPSDPVYTLYGATTTVGDNVTVEGTTTGITSVDLRCYPGDANPPSTVANDVPVTGGQFSTTADLTAVLESCVLRAVPHGQTPSGSALAAFPGVRLLPTSYTDSWTTPSGAQYDYEYLLPGTRGLFDTYSAGDLSTSWSTLVDPSTLSNAPKALAANVFALFYADYGEEAPTRSEIEVDGASAYTPYGAVWVSNTAHYSTPGIPSISVISETLDPQTGNSTFVIDEPIVKCSPQSDWASNMNNYSTSCTKFVTTGVILERTLDFGADGRTLGVTDTWRSPGPQSHQIDVLYDNRFNGNNTGFPSYTQLSTSGFKFPGGSAFQDYAYNSTASLPQGPGTIYYKTDRASADNGGDGLPQGAVSYSSAPDTFRFIGSDLDHYLPEWTMGYQRTVPARGETRFAFQLAQAGGQPELQSLSDSFESQYRSPAISGGDTTQVSSGGPAPQPVVNTPGVAAAGLKRAAVRTRWSGSRILVETGETGTCSSGSGNCSFTFLAKLGRRTIGKGTLKLAAGHSAKIAFKLSKRWTKQLARNRTFRVTLKVTPKSGTTAARATTRVITIKAPKPKK